MLQLLRNPSRLTDNEWNYKLAQAASARQEGYELIARGAPWVTVAMAPFAEKEQQHGPIPYFLAARDRKTLLQEIDKPVGKEIEKDAAAKDNHNWILVAAMLFRRNLRYDTYEEAKAAEEPAIKNNE